MNSLKLLLILVICVFSTHGFYKHRFLNKKTTIFSTVCFPEKTPRNTNTNDINVEYNLDNKSNLYFLVGNKSEKFDRIIKDFENLKIYIKPIILDPTSVKIDDPWIFENDIEISIFDLYDRQMISYQ